MSGSLSVLFPVPPARISTGFTTAGTLDTLPIAPVALADKVLGVHRSSAKAPHTLAVPPIPVPTRTEDASSTTTSPATLAWEAAYPEGSINPRDQTAPTGGFGFYLKGPPSFAEELRGANEVLMSYDLLFEEGWEWAKGGKLPGIFGGDGDLAYGCTGGRQTDRSSCFNLRLMWREDGLGELYAYLPSLPRNIERLLAVPPLSVQHPDYGFSVGRGAWRFPVGVWTTVAERVRLNDVGLENGEIEVFIDGVSVIRATGLVLRVEDGPNVLVQGMHFQTFFGGHSTEWASPRDQKAWFANVSGAVLQPAPDHAHDEL